MENSDKILITMLYAITGGIILIIFIKNRKKRDFSPSYSGLMFGTVLYYIIIPIITIVNIESMMEYENSLGMWGDNSISRFILNQPLFYYIYSTIMLMLMIGFFNMFYKIGYKNNNDTANIVVPKNEKRMYNVMNIFNYMVFFIGSISLIIFFASFHGIRNALSYAEYMRSFSTSLSDMIGKNSIFIVPAKLITIVPFFSLILMNQKKENNNIIYRSMFIISNIMSILYFMFNAGKMPILIFILCYLYMYLKKHTKKTWTTIIILGIIALPILGVLDNLFIYLKTGTFSKIYDVNYYSYIYQFIYPFRNIINLIPMANRFGFNYGKDFITSFIDMLPGISFEASYINTSIYTHAENTWQILGGVPNDIITFFHIEGGAMGIMILSSILGLISQRIDINLSKVKNYKNKTLMEGILTLCFFQLVCNADFVVLLRSNFTLTLFLILIIYLGKGGKKVKNEYIIHNR